MSSKTNLKELRAYFKSLATPQKKVFIQNLQKKISGVKDSKYQDFLLECTKEYNSELSASKKAAGGPAPPRLSNDARPQKMKAAPEPKLSDESFAIALAAMLSPQAPSQKSIAARLCGRWEREHGGKVFYFDFKKDGTFETNETSGGEALGGRYTTGLDGMLLLEQGEVLGISNIMLSANNLVIGFANGDLFEYKRPAQ